jgi:hypothetical protein
VQDILTAGIDRRRLLIAGAAALSLNFPSGIMAAEGTSNPSRDFDFLFGRWTVKHRKLRERLKGSTEWFEFPGSLEVDPILGGAGNIDRNDLDDPAGFYRATSLRLFDAAQNQWSIYWIDERFPGLDNPVVGRFEGRVGQFFTTDEFQGRAILVRFVYENLSSESARWSQAFSPDGGASWEVNWIMEFSKVEPR